MNKMIIKQKIRNDIQSRLDIHNYLFHTHKVDKKTNEDKKQQNL